MWLLSYCLFEHELVRTLFCEFKNDWPWESQLHIGAWLYSFWTEVATDGNFQAHHHAEGKVPTKHCCEGKQEGLDGRVHDEGVVE